MPEVWRVVADNKSKEMIPMNMKEIEKIVCKECRNSACKDMEIKRIRLSRCATFWLVKEIDSLKNKYL